MAHNFLLTEGKKKQNETSVLGVFKPAGAGCQERKGTRRNGKTKRNKSVPKRLSGVMRFGSTDTTSPNKWTDLDAVHTFVPAKKESYLVFYSEIHRDVSFGSVLVTCVCMCVCVSVRLAQPVNQLEYFFHERQKGNGSCRGMYR